MFPPRLRHWVVEPLVDAGLTLEQVRDLVTRLGFDAVVHGEGFSVGSIQRLVDDQSLEVRDAWARTVGRLLALDERAPGRP